MPATKPKIVSLKTNIKIAADAPNPASKETGEFIDKNTDNQYHSNKENRNLQDLYEAF